MVLQHAQIGNIIHDIRHWMSLLTECSLSSINRERNTAADALSRRILDEHEDVISFLSPPWLLQYLYWPYTI